MPKSDFEVVVIGGGAAGIAAARRLTDAGLDCLLVEARSRLGGRAFTSADPSGAPLDLGCGWLDLADRSPWTEIAGAQGRTIDKTPPPWMRPSTPIGFPLEQQKDFRDALFGFHGRMEEFPESGPDVSAGALLEPSNRWNPLIGAVSTYLSGTEPENFSARDFARYDDSGVNWRVVEGYGTAIAAHAAGVPVRLGCPVKL